ncbi:Bro-N domain-containing protein [Enterobacter cancerogenus]|uniref:BRO-N domain-containing protein n=1 Tax=Enterobacter cancerogenus TaxID=69218 RepID=UPI00384C5FD8
MNAQLSFHETQFNVVNHNNQIWFTAVEIAKALRYKSDDSVTKIYNRNHEEFSPGMSETVNLTVSGNLTKSVRIFSLRGAHLIAMFARTPVAKEFRRWVLDILDREVGEAVTQPLISPISYDSRTLCYKRNGVTINELPLRDDELVITLESWVQLAQNNGWVAMRQEELIDKLVRGIERSLVKH